MFFGRERGGEETVSCLFFWEREGEGGFFLFLRFSFENKDF